MSAFTNQRLAQIQTNFTGALIAEVAGAWLNERAQLHGTTPPPVLEVPIDPDEPSIRHREDQAWIAKVTESMRYDLRDLYERRENYIRREMNERLTQSAQALQHSRTQYYAKDTELKRALETVGRQQIELEELRKQLGPQNGQKCPDPSFVVVKR